MSRSPPPNSPLSGPPPPSNTSIEHKGSRVSGSGFSYLPSVTTRISTGTMGAITLTCESRRGPSRTNPIFIDCPSTVVAQLVGMFSKKENHIVPRAIQNAPPGWAWLNPAKQPRGSHDGVGGMHSSCDGEQVTNVRVLEFLGVQTADSRFINRMFTEVVLKAHGLPLEYFQDNKQLLLAFRDAVAGHRSLWNKGILHRDISAYTVLLGLPDASAGNRGILIDRDFAICTDRREPLTVAGFRTGTRAFQSVSILMSGTRTQPPHDYLDDLESFFYVLCWICFGYNKAGEKIRPQPEILMHWESPSALLAKEALPFIVKRMGIESMVSPYFGQPFYDLVQDLLEFVNKMLFRKCRLAQPPSIGSLKAASVGHYNTYIGFIDKAIAALDAPEEPPQRLFPFTSPIHPSTSTPSPHYNQGEKRAKPDDSEFVQGSSRRKRVKVSSRRQSSRLSHSESYQPSPDSGSDGNEQ